MEFLGVCLRVNGVLDVTTFCRSDTREAAMAMIQPVLELYRARYPQADPEKDLYVVALFADKV